MVKNDGIGYITPTYTYITGVPSVLLSREVVDSETLAKDMVNSLLPCKEGGPCGRLELYIDITGAIDSPRTPDKDVSISTGFRNALIHLVFGEIE